ncbi:YidC/Oxa1 family membrane protein insertase [Ferrimicrobium acidiphilum]|jgi:YidC/Oxa1 family membrane protein insertase|uniref:Membrane protein insertase YidC n=1 Tax=Ferrimicrobium acidiphilum DSM 19497 TaxID=1121877 RepID=A0A0D8FU09_9ACTN|nr:YidC/Oxa1 family membrane protein insertase [Ferrimicrobium acidiphilum]KJE76444.1 membrane protein insertase YidC [Ferrimicrobium acidiphilum DSM 19497]
MNILGDILRPLFDLLAGIITFWYALIPSYGVAIALLTVTVMVAISPLTIKSTKSMLQMQAIQPKIKELQKQFKGDRQGLAEAQQALFKENKVSPAGGCLPMLLQFPLLIVMYDVIRGLTNTVKTSHGIVASPKYIIHSSLLYKHLVLDHGVMKFLGLNLTLSALHLHLGFFNSLPYYLLVIASVGLQYLQIKQITGKNPSAAAANPMASKTQQISTLVFGFIYLDIPAGVVVYFLVSGIFRVVQQELMWRHDPTLRSHSLEARKKAADAKQGQVIEAKEIVRRPSPPRNLLRRLLPGATPALSTDNNASPMDPPKPRPRDNRSNKKKKRR